MQLPRILLISTGGTITMTSDQGAGIVPTLSGTDLVQAVPELAQKAEIEVLAYSTKPGPSLMLEDLLEMAKILDVAFDEGFDGAIVVQGTDTIEETAFILNLLVASDRPLVITGAMRGPTAAGADGPANLLAATIVAACQTAIGLGTLVVLNDEVHAGQFVQKSHTAMPSAFASPGLGPIGRVIEGDFHLYLRPLLPKKLPKPASLNNSAVALIKVTLGDDGRLLPALAKLDFRGAVIEAMGAGHLPALYAPLISDLVKQMPVILSSRVYSGPVFNKTYGFPGSEMDSIARGAIPSGMISANKACLLLRLLLALGYQSEQLKQEFILRSKNSVSDSV